MRILQWGVGKLRVVYHCGKGRSCTIETKRSADDELCLICAALNDDAGNGTSVFFRSGNVALHLRLLVLKNFCHRAPMEIEFPSD